MTKQVKRKGPDKEGRTEMKRKQREVHQLKRSKRLDLFSIPGVLVEMWGHSLGRSGALPLSQAKIRLPDIQLPLGNLPPSPGSTRIRMEVEVLFLEVGLPTLLPLPILSLGRVCVCSLLFIRIAEQDNIYLATWRPVILPLYLPRYLLLGTAGRSLQPREQ